MNARAIILGLSLLGLSSAAVAATPACRPTIVKAWIRATPPGATAMAGYAIVRNPCAAPFVLKGLRAGDFAMAMIHETQVANGVSQMRQAGSLSVPARGELVFAPGGRHLMLMHPTKNLKVGDRTSLALDFAGGVSVAADFTISKDAPAK